MDNNQQELSLHVLLTRQGVDQGDHGQDMTRALDVPSDMTVGDLARAVLTKPVWISVNEPRSIVPDPDAYLTIRIALRPEEGSR